MNDRNEYALTLIENLAKQFSNQSLDAAQKSAKSGEYKDEARWRVLNNIHSSLTEAEHHLQKLIAIDGESAGKEE